MKYFWIPEQMSNQPSFETALEYIEYNFYTPSSTPSSSSLWDTTSCEVDIKEKIAV